MATIKDVAQLAQVNQAIVSRIINHDETLVIRDATRARVLRAIEELNYTPSYLGRSLRANATKTLAIFVPDILNPFYAEVLTGAERAATQHGFRVMIFHTEDSQKKEEELIGMAISYHVDGFLIASSLLGSTSHDRIAEYKKPCVFLQRRAKEADADSFFITADDARGVELALDYLLGLGHTRIAHIAGPGNMFSARQRKQAFCRVLSERGSLIPEYLIDGDFKLDAGYLAMQKLLALAQLPTAVLCCNDLAAIGAINAITAGGLRVPEDISVVGFDDIWIAAQTRPALTTVRISAGDQGALAVDTIISLLKDQSIQPRTVMIPPQLVVRSSAAACRPDP